jgi:hypothetical protein
MLQTLAFSSVKIKLVLRSNSSKPSRISVLGAPARSSRIEASYNNFPTENQHEVILWNPKAEPRGGGIVAQRVEKRDGNVYDSY